MWPVFSPPPCVVTVFLVLQVPTGDAITLAACGCNTTAALSFGGPPALFGPPPPSKSLLGLLVEARPKHACHALQSLPNASSIFVVLVRWPNCSFAAQILNAQAAGFRAPVEYAWDSQPEAEASIHIPALLPAHVKQLHRSGKLMSVVLVPEYFHFAWKFPSGPASLSSSRSCPCHIHLLAACLQIASLHACWLVCLPVSALIAMLLIEKYLSRGKRWRRRSSHIFEENDKELAAFLFTSSRYQECAICLDKYMECDSLKVLSCLHAFHSKCIDLWHITQGRCKTCPLCMQKVMVVTRLQAVRLWRDGMRENSWTLWSYTAKRTSGQRPCLLLSPQLPTQY